MSRVGQLHSLYSLNFEKEHWAMLQCSLTEHETVWSEKVVDGWFKCFITSSLLGLRLSCYWPWISSSHCQSSLRIHSAIASWIHSYFDDVMTKFMINNRTDAWKTDVNLLNWGSISFTQVSMLKTTKVMIIMKGVYFRQLLLKRCVAFGQWVR